jgi:excisionase family DNA binding protein
MVDPILNTVEAAAFLGVRPPTVRKWKAERRLPCVVVGGTAIRFRQSELVKFLKAGERPALRPVAAPRG